MDFKPCNMLMLMQTYRPPAWVLLPGVSPQQSCGVKAVPPPSVQIWSNFNSECQALLDALPEGGPINVTLPVPAPNFVGSELQLQDELQRVLLSPLREAAGSFFVCGRMMMKDVEDLPMNAGRPDFVVLTDNMKVLLLSVEVKTSAVLWVAQHSSSLPAAYAAAAAAGKGAAASNVEKGVTQMYSYLGSVPYGVLMTDRQLFCVRREGATLLCSPSIPATAEHDKGGRQRGPGSLTAVAAVYCILMMSLQWRAQRQLKVVSKRRAVGGAVTGPKGPYRMYSSPGGGGSGGGAGDSSQQRRSSLPILTPNAAKSAVATEPAPLLLPPAAAEGEFTSSQLFPGCSFGPPPAPAAAANGPRFLGDSSWGVVMQGWVSGRPAAVKLVDLWNAAEGKQELHHEVRMYQKLQPLQGLYVPRLLGYGYCDGWQYFVATSLEGAPLSREEGWALGREATCVAAFAALDKVHACGVLHGDIALRNFVQAAAGGGAAGCGEDAGGWGSHSSLRQGCQQQRVMLLDFGLAELAAEAGERWGLEPAVLMQRERKELQALLACGPPLPVGAGLGAETTATLESPGDDAYDATGEWQQPAQQGPPDEFVLPADGAAAAGGPSPPAALGTRRSSAGRLPAPPLPRLPCRLGGWRQQCLRLHVPRNI